MSAGIVRLEAGRRSALRVSFYVVSFFTVIFSNQVFATTSDAQLLSYLTGICNGTIQPAPGVVWDTNTLSTMCNNLGGFASGGGSVSGNLGTTNAGDAINQRKKKRLRELDDQKKKADEGASADDGGWGFLVTPQYGRGNRRETDLENGYHSELVGLVAGLDYRFSDSLVLGAAIGQTRDNAAFLYDAGSLKTSNNSFTLYSTWMPSENNAVDGYLGYGKISLDSRRNVAVIVGLAGITGVTNGSTNGQQIMAGVSTSHQIDMGRFNLAPFFSLDYIKTRINGYNETGTTTLEMRYGDRRISSLTGSLGVRVDASYGYSWGTLQPNAHLATVHEFQNNAQQISNGLVSAPGSGFLVSTDAPDRNYLNVGMGVTAALDRGTQLFFDYEQRAQDRLLSTWAVSIGALTEF